MIGNLIGRYKSKKIQKELKAELEKSKNAHTKQVLSRFVGES